MVLSANRPNAAGASVRSIGGLPSADAPRPTGERQRRSNLKGLHPGGATAGCNPFRVGGLGGRLPRVGARANPGLKDGTPLAFGPDSSPSIVWLAANSTLTGVWRRCPKSPVYPALPGNANGVPIPQPRVAPPALPWVSAGSGSQP